MALLLRRDFISLLFCFVIIKCILISNGKKINNIKPYNITNVSKNKKINVKIESFSNYSSHEQKNFIGKDFIYKELDDERKFFLKIIFIIFMIISIISIILICIDLNEDKKNIKKYNLTINLKANEEYKQLKKTFIARSQCSFSFFLMKYIYPPLSIFYIYNYDYPRYIRFVISIIQYLINAFFCICIVYIPIYYSSNHDQKGPFLGIVLIKVFFIFFFLIIYHFICDLIVRYLLNYDEKNRNIFKSKYENLRKYVYYSIKKDILFNSKWRTIRNRIISYNRICGKSILINKKLDKYGKYAMNKIIYKTNNINKISNYVSCNSLTIGQERDFEINSELSERLLPPSNSLNPKIKESNKLKNNINNSISLIKENFKNNDNLYIIKSIESFSFSKFGINNMKLKSVQKIEDIKNRYIINKNEIKYDETLDVHSYVKTYDNLEIEALENYTYISTDKMINKLNKINSNSNRILINLFINFILFIFLILITQGLFHLYFQTKSVFHLFYIFISTIFIGNLIIYFLICFITPCLISKYYGKRKKNCLNKLIFKLFIEKHILYLYKMRLLLIKYHKEFDYMDK